MVAALSSLAYLGFSIAAGRKVELVALVGKLGDTLNVNRLESAYLSFHAEAEQIFGIISETFLLSGTFCVCSVHFRALYIVLGNGQRLKISAAAQLVHSVVNCFEVYGLDLGELSLNYRALGRIVVNENKAFGQEIQLLCGVGNIYVLGIPVSLYRGKVVRVEDGTRVV